MTTRRGFNSTAATATAASVLGAAALFGTSGSAFAQAGPQQNAVAALGGLIDVLIQDVNLNVQNVLNNSLNNLAQNALQNARILNLRDVLNGNQVRVLSDLIQNSHILSDFTVTLTNVLNNLGQNALQNFLNNNNVDINRVIAIGNVTALNGVNVLSAPLTIFVL